MRLQDLPPCHYIRSYRYCHVDDYPAHHINNVPIMFTSDLSSRIDIANPALTAWPVTATCCARQYCISSNPSTAEMQIIAYYPGFWWISVWLYHVLCCFNTASVLSSRRYSSIQLFTETDHVYSEGSVCSSHTVQHGQWHLTRAQRCRSILSSFDKMRHLCSVSVSV